MYSVRTDITVCTVSRILEIVRDVQCVHGILWTCVYSIVLYEVYSTVGSVYKYPSTVYNFTALNSIYINVHISTDHVHVCVQYIQSKYIGLLLVYSECIFCISVIKKLLGTCTVYNTVKYYAV